MSAKAKCSTSVRLSEDLDRDIRAAAKTRGQSISGLIEEVLDEWLLFRNERTRPAGVQGVNGARPSA